MYCPYCGAQLPEGSKFCGACGAKLSDMGASQAGMGKGRNEENKRGGFEQEHTERGKSPLSRKLWAGVGVLAILVIAVGAVFLLKGRLFSGGKGNAYVCLADGSYELITNLKKGTSIEIASSKSDDAMGGMLSFSQDGKYIYYYTKYDNESGTGSLCKAEYGKLKKDSGRNDKYIEIIDTNVLMGFRLLDDGNLLYQNGDSNLYYYDGKESTQVAKEVSGYYANDAKRVFYMTGNYDEGYVLYGVDLDKVDERVKLDSDVHNVYLYDSDHVVYSKTEEDGRETLYAAGLEKEEEKLGSGVSVAGVVDASVYFTADNGNTLNLYDYVTDEFQAADAELTEPDLESYATPTYDYYQMSSTSNPAEYGEIYTSCTKSSAFFYYGSGSMESAAQYDAEHGKDYQAFVDKYKGQEDANGYFVVTDAVKNDLMTLAGTCGQGYDGEWMEFCFYKAESGEDYDYEAYDAACDAYAEAQDRIDMRAQLQNPENACPVKTLYCYSDGKVTPICENVLNYAGFSTYNVYGSILYNTTDLIENKLKIEDVTSPDDVKNAFAINYEAENNLLALSSGSVLHISEKAAESLAEANSNNYVDLYVTSKSLYLNDGNRALSVADISKDEVQAFSLITDDAGILNVEETGVYYISGTYEHENFTYGDLYFYTNGESRRLARDIITGNIQIYSDDVILSYTDGNSYGYELTMTDKDGEQTVIADDVKQVVRIDGSHIMYISDGDLYSYTGKEKTKIARNVDYVWVKDKMDIKYALNWY